MSPLTRRVASRCLAATGSSLPINAMGEVVITLAFTPITALSPETEPFKRYQGLSVIPLPVWRSFKSNLERRERFDPVRAAFSVFVASALACPSDGQGRILVPPALRGFLSPPKSPRMNPGSGSLRRRRLPGRSLRAAARKTASP